MILNNPNCKVYFSTVPYDKGNLWLGEIEGDFRIVSEKRFVKDFTISVESFEKLTNDDRIKIQKYISDVVLPHIVDKCSDNVDLAELTITDQNYKYNPR